MRIVGDLAACLLVASAALPSGTLARSPAPAEREYDLPAQDLEAALLSFGRQSGVDIVYERAILRGLRSAPLKGVFAPPVAVATLLRGTGLEHRFTSMTAVLVVRPAARGQADVTKDVSAGAGGRAGAPQIVLDRLRITARPMIGRPRPDYQPYGQIVRNQITRQLFETPGIRGRRFETRLAVRLDPVGVIRWLAVKRSTGDTVLDEAIVRALEGASMPIPTPEGMPQPIWFEIVAR